MATTDPIVTVESVTIDESWERKALERTYRYLDALTAQIDQLVALVPEERKACAELLGGQLLERAEHYVIAGWDYSFISILRKAPWLVDAEMAGRIYSAITACTFQGFGALLTELDDNPPADASVQRWR